MRHYVSKIVFSLVLFALIGLGVSTSAKADSFIINQTNFMGNGNFGTITTTLVGNTIQVQVNLNAGLVIHGQGVGFNVVGDTTGVNVTGISPNAFFSFPGGSGNMDGFGSFAFQVAGSTTSVARANNLNSVTFTVSRTAGFTNANQIGGANASGNFFGLQIAPLDPQANTGFAASNLQGAPVPEPASMLLLGTGLVGLAAGARRRRKRS